MTKNENGQYIITAMGIIAVCGLEAMALQNGLNGTYFGAALGAIGVMVGYAWGLTKRAKDGITGP